MSSRSEQVNEIGAALAKAQLGIVGATKDSTNPHFKSSYADLESVWAACHTQLNANGIAIVQVTDIASGQLMLTTMLIHASGQWLSSEYPITPVQNTPQGFGSALTYARRYCLMSMAGVAGRDDDDGNAASTPGGFQGLPQETRRGASYAAAQQSAVQDFAPKPAEAPPVPDVVTTIPDFFFKGPFKPLAMFEKVRFAEMSTEDLEQIITLVSDNKAAIKSDSGRSWANAIEAAATLTLRDKQDVG